MNPDSTCGPDLDVSSPDPNSFSYRWGDTHQNHAHVNEGIFPKTSASLPSALEPDSQENVVDVPQLETKCSLRSQTDDQTLALDTSMVSTATMDLSGDQSDLLKTRSGTLRKYATLNFDLDDHPSVCFNEDEGEGEDSAPGSDAILLQNTQFEIGSPTSINALESPRSRKKKLRKKVRPESSIPLVAQSPPPVYDLPAGIEQIGMGIGYTRPAEAHHSRLSISTLTPRTCHALFSGSRLPYFKQDPRKAGSKPHLDNHLDTSAQTSAAAVMQGGNASEDQMDAVMREIYGSAWNLGLSSTDVNAVAAPLPAATVAAGPSTTGLGLSGSTMAMMDRAQYAAPPPAELLTMSPDSTLRLVTPSTSSLAP